MPSTITIPPWLQSPKDYFTGLLYGSSDGSSHAYDSLPQSDIGDEDEHLVDDDDYEQPVETQGQSADAHIHIELNRSLHGSGNNHVEPKATIENMKSADSIDVNSGSCALDVVSPCGTSYTDNSIVQRNIHDQDRLSLDFEGYIKNK